MTYPALALLTLAPLASELYHDLHQHAGSFYFGETATEVGDIDGDGVPDVAVASLFSKVELFSGRDGSLIGAVSEPNAGSIDFAASLAGPGDQNGDGVPDLAVGCPTFFGQNQPGAVRIYSGVDGSVVRTLQGPFAGEDFFGFSIAAVGDVDLDGTGDLLVGAFADETAGTDAGAAYLYSGADGAVLLSLLGAPGDWFGNGVGRAGDADGDGVPDLAIGAYGGNLPGYTAIHSGADGSQLWSTPGFEYGGPLTTVGDLDDDGRDDLARPEWVGARLVVFSGLDGSALIDLATDNLGAVAGPGDVDGDGVEDILIGTPLVSAGVGLNNNGAVHLVSGQDQTYLQSWFGPISNSRLGDTLALCGDVDADGIQDFLFDFHDGPLAQTGMVSIQSSACPLHAYCIAKTTASGCVPEIYATGSPAAGGNSFRIKARSIPENRSGLLFWGRGSAATPFLGGFKCVAPPTVRTPIQNSGFGGPCAGGYSFHFSQAYMAAQGVQSGETLHAQYWFRDPASPFTTGLSDGLRFDVCP